MAGRITTLLLLLALPATAEPQGSHAADGRWPHPDGPASGSGLSHSRAPDSFGRIAWTHEAGEILATPLVWDGVVHLVTSGGLVALDASDGSVRARGEPQGRPDLRGALHQGALHLTEDRTTVVQYRIRGSRLQRRWSIDAGEKVSAPRVLAGEIYVTSSKGLLRLRAESRSPVWIAEGPLLGQPAVLGEHVYAVERRDGAIHLVAFERATGKRVTDTKVVNGKGTGRDARVAAGSGVVAVLLPTEKDGAWAMVHREEAGGTLELRTRLRVRLRTAPLLSKGRALVLDEGGFWRILFVEAGKARALVNEKMRPDLVGGATAPVSIGGVAVCGSWAFQPETLEILWHLDERKEIRTFQKGVRFRAAPAGNGLLLVVSHDGSALHAIAPEELGS